MLPPTFTVRRLVAAAIAVVVLIGLIMAIVRYATIGTLDVTVSGKNTTLVIRNLKTNTTVATVTGARVTKRLRSGSYVVTAAAGSALTSRTIVVTAHHTTQTTVAAQPLTAIMPVASFSTSSLTADQAGLSYLNNDDTGLYHLDTAGNLRPFAGASGFVSIKWASSQYGIGLQNNGKLYKIDGQTVAPLAVPFTYKSTSAVSYGIGTDHTIYVSDGTAVYRITSDGTAEKLSTTVQRNPRVIAVSSQGSVLIEGETGDAPKSDTKQTDEERANSLLKDSDQPVEVAVVLPSGAVTRHNFTLAHGQQYTAIWSPNGQKILIAGFGQAVITDTGFRTVSRLPVNTIDQADWRDDDTVIYNDPSNIWSFRTSDQQSVKLALLNNDLGLVDLAVNNSQATVYLVTRNQNQGTSLGRLSLNPTANAAVPSQLSKLTSLLPFNEDGCNLGYTNFTSFSVTLVAETSYQAYCTEKAQRYFALYGVNMNGIPIVFNPPAN